MRSAGCRAAHVAPVVAPRIASLGAWNPRPATASTRALAEQTGVAVNTVARAYRELEADGVIETRGRAGSFVAAQDDVPAALRDAAVAYARLARRLGAADEDARRVVDQALAAG
jgi:DNA-binding transcriptional regulator YhcF (GntR family)